MHQCFSGRYRYDDLHIYLNSTVLYLNADVNNSDMTAYVSCHAKAMDTDGDGSFSIQEFTRVVVERVLAAESSSETGGTAPTQAWQDPPDKLTSAPAPELETAAEENVRQMQFRSCLPLPAISFNLNDRALFCIPCGTLSP